MLRTGPAGRSRLDRRRLSTGRNGPATWSTHGGYRPNGADRGAMTWETAPRWRGQVVGEKTPRRTIGTRATSASPAGKAPAVVRTARSMIEPSSSWRSRCCRSCMASSCRSFATRGRAQAHAAAGQWQMLRTVWDPRFLLRRARKGSKRGKRPVHEHRRLVHGRHGWCSSNCSLSRIFGHGKSGRGS
jgi:hypothetical protein